MKRYTLFGTPIYFEFLAGKRDLTCSAWAIPTRNIRGWKGPCYLMTDDALLRATRSCWRKWSGTNTASSNGVARDQPLRELHGPLRLRADCEPWASSATRRHLEDGQVQFRPETETDRPRQRDRSPTTA